MVYKFVLFDTDGSSQSKLMMTGRSEAAVDEPEWTDPLLF